MIDSLEIPQPPEISLDQLESCRESGDYCPVMFEWYKYTGLICNYYASIQIDSPAVRTIQPIHYAVLIGLLNRCARLMFSNVALSHEGLFGETTSIIDRCIFESALKVIWLCKKGDEESFLRFLADGLKTELDFKKSINTKITNRSGEKLIIEERMLASIDRYIASAELSEDQIASAKRLPDLAAMINTIGHDRLLHIVGQKIGSHHIHGTWPSLWLHYLEEEKGILVPRDHDCPTHINQYVFIPLVVIEAMKAFVRFVFPDSGDVQALLELIESVTEEIQELNREVIGDDFENVREI